MVVCCLPAGVASVGTPIELALARKYGIPIVLATDIPYGKSVYLDTHVPEDMRAALVAGDLNRGMSNTAKLVKKCIAAGLDKVAGNSRQELFGRAVDDNNYERGIYGVRPELDMIDMTEEINHACSDPHCMACGDIGPANAPL
jgi:hypothetical protein